MTDKEKFNSLLNDEAKERLKDQAVRLEYLMFNGKTFAVTIMSPSDQEMDAFVKHFFGQYVAGRSNDLLGVVQRSEKAIFNKEV